MTARGDVHVIDDDWAVREAIALLLQSAGLGVEVHISGVAFLDALPALDPDGIDCVLTDVQMPDLDGITMLSRLRDMSFRRPVIVMTAVGDIAMAVRAMKAGASDFLEKPFDDEVLLKMIAAATTAEPKKGETSALAEHAATDAHSKSAEAVRRMAELSPREREVLDRLLAGKPNKLIAYELGISQRTAEMHRARLMMRLKVRTLAEALRLAVLAGLADGER
jgi:two-component system response regulator FixJ